MARGPMEQRRTPLSSRPSHHDPCPLDTRSTRYALTRVSIPPRQSPLRAVNSGHHAVSAVHHPGFVFTATMTPLADLPWAHYRVRLQLRVRKGFCRNRHCPRPIFTERLPTVVAPWARRTLRLAHRFAALPSH